MALASVVLLPFSVTWGSARRFCAGSQLELVSLREKAAATGFQAKEAWSQEPVV